MAKSRISADVQYANSALARFLMLQEEEEQLLQIGKRKPKRDREPQRLPVGRGRWRIPADFKTPTCMVDRPRTQQGATSFHFAYETVTKRAIPVLGGMALEGLPRSSKQGALDHAKYIERAGAAELSEASVHGEYVERDGAVEMVDSNALMRAAMERQLAIAYGETQPPLKVTRPSVFSNISDDPEVRQRYWRDIEESERTPRTHELFFQPRSSPLWWAGLEAETGLDEDLKRHLLQVRLMSEQHAGEEGEGAPFKPAPFVVKSKGKVSGEERAGRLLNQAMGLRGYVHSDPPMKFKSGSGGRTQIRMVAELPHELNAEDRARIVMRFCELLGSLETRQHEDGTERRVGIMYTAVVHAPDAHNDHRNYHLHIVAHDRPARWLDDHGCWDFQYQEHFKHRGEKRVRYPFKQKKISQVTQGSHVTKLQNSGRDFLPFLRREYARITNEMFEERGIERRYDPRTYAKMGITRTPTEHLGTAAAALEAIGVPTPVGTLNAITIWRDADENIKREVRQYDERLKEAQIDFEKVCNELLEAMPHHTQLAEFERLIAERKRLSRNLSEDREALMRFDNLEAKAKSRATRTARTCQVYISEIANQEAAPFTVSMSQAIEARYRDAHAHLNAVDAALEPHRRILDEAGRQVKSRMDRIKVIDANLSELVQQRDLAVRLKAEMDIKGDKERTAEAARKAKKVGRTEEALPQTSSQPESKIPFKPPEQPSAEVQANRGDLGPNVETSSAPITIDGVPIVEPSIPQTALRPASEGAAPRQDEKPKDSDAAKVDLGDGAVAEPRQVQITDSLTASTEISADRSAEDSKPTKPTVAPSNDAIAAKYLEEMQAERKWNSVILRIRDEKIPISCHETADGKTRYAVSGLSAEEQQSLEVKKFASRTFRRLEALHKLQRQEASRLCRWIAENGHRPEKLSFVGEEGSLGTAEKAIKTLWRNWKNDAEVVEALSAARDKRDIEQATVGLQADHQTEFARADEMDAKVSEPMNKIGFSSPSGSPPAEGSALKEEQSKDGSESGREGGGYEHKDEEEKSDCPLRKQANENTGENDDDEWLRTLGAFANRHGKRGR